MRKGKSAYNPWNHISHKELTYLLQKSTSYQSKVLCACSQGDRLVGKDYHSSPIATHKEDNQRNTSCFKFVTQRLPYVHATGLANLNTSISQFHNYPTSMTLTLPPLYLKKLSSIKFILVFNALSMIVFIIPNLDAHHSRTNFITIANTMLF